MPKSKNFDAVARFFGLLEPPFLCTAGILWKNLFFFFFFRIFSRMNDFLPIFENILMHAKNLNITYTCGAPQWIQHRKASNQAVSTLYSNINKDNKKSGTTRHVACISTFCCHVNVFDLDFLISLHLFHMTTFFRCRCLYVPVRICISIHTFPCCFSISSRSSYRYEQIMKNYFHNKPKPEIEWTNYMRIHCGDFSINAIA